ncbi:4910_t:CDS:2 [Funneliformis mosseae]|uniref:4910_t:CDS:1 n=1 Tax=Funneliformis mosseae TaxID=27381 RepID=A0A9N8VK87_FUNMO|nr:4910_t:CDS:2 [Funneliformis mosseae]
MDIYFTITVISREQIRIMFVRFRCVCFHDEFPEIQENLLVSFKASSLIETWRYDLNISAERLKLKRKCSEGVSNQGKRPGVVSHDEKCSESDSQGENGIKNEPHHEKCPGRDSRHETLGNKIKHFDSEFTLRKKEMEFFCPIPFFDWIVKKGIN